MSVDLRTEYLGLQLSNPLVVSASPRAERIERWKREMQRRYAPALAAPPAGAVQPE